MNIEQVWEESFLAAIAEKEKETGTNPVDWRAGGRATKANPDKENKAWWDVNGKQMFNNFIVAWRESGFKVWIAPNNTPGIEIALSAAPLPGTPLRPPSACQIQSNAEIRSLITMIAKGASGATSYPFSLISRALSSSVNQ